MTPTTPKTDAGETTTAMGDAGAIHVSGQLVDVANQIRAAGGLLENGGTVVGQTKAAPAKAGWKTTEFWVTVLVAVGSVAASATDNLPPRYAEIATTISVVAYALSRGIAKH